MALYKYTAKNEMGKKISGRLDVQDEDALYHRLRSDGLYLLNCKQITKSAQGKRIKQRYLAEFARQIGTLLQAGVSLVRALAIVSQEESTKPVHRAIYENLLRLIRQGTPLSEAMRQQGDAFPPLMIEMFRSAEASGTLDQTALRMGDHYNKEYKLNSKIHNAMIYPCILAGLCVVVVIFILTFVLPQFESLFSQLTVLPLPTRVLYAIGDFIKTKWPVLLVGIVVLIAIFTLILRIPRVRLGVDKAKLKMPVFGKLLRVIYTARFARSLCSLYSAGLPIVTSLQIGRKIVSNAYIDSQFDGVIAHVRSGGNLSDGLSQVDGFVNKMSSSIMIGEETGSLDSMLDAIADTLDYESEMAINKMVTFLEPILIIVMALIVGFIMVAVITPIYDSYNAIESSAF